MSTSSQPATFGLVSIPALPTNFVSPEESTAIRSSTPADFNALPPVLSLTVKAGKITLPSGEQKVADIYLASDALYFVLSEDGKCMKLDYPSIELHAVQSSPEVCIYMQVDDMDPSKPRASEESREVADGPQEIFVFPAEGGSGDERKAAVQEMYSVLTDISSRYPDKYEADASFMPEDIQMMDEAYFAEEILIELKQARLESLVDWSTVPGQQQNEGQFDDASPAVAAEGETLEPTEDEKKEREEAAKKRKLNGVDKSTDEKTSA